MDEMTLNEGFEKIYDGLEAYETEAAHRVFSALVGMAPPDSLHDSDEEVYRVIQAVLDQFSPKQAEGLVRICMSFWNSKLENGY